jgi:hypothetical protein
MSLELGNVLGPYRVLRRLGAGGMGEVYVAEDPRLGREVAIKVLPPDMVRDGESLKRFQQEALAVAALNHTNIVQVYDVGTAEDGSPFLVMELLEGETLRARMGSKPMPVRKVAEVAAQLARALGVAHAKGIIHRDLKPENVYLTKQGPLKILDFGLAKLAARQLPEASEDATRALRTQAGMVMGTIGYMAPEQVQGLAVDGRADIFALGVVMWEMLSGSRPFRGDSAIDTMHAILREDPPEISPDLGLPSAMERILRRCLEKDPDARFQSAQDLSFQLENLAEASGMARTQQLHAVEGDKLGPKPWYRSPHRFLYPLPIQLPPRLRICFWDRVQLSGAYLVLAAILVTAALAVGGILSLGRFGHSEIAEQFEPVVEMTGSIQSAAISRDGKFAVFAVSDENGTVKLLYREGSDIRSVQVVEKPPATEVLAVANTGSALLRNGDGALFQMEMSKDASAMKIATSVLEADLSTDGTKVALLRKNAKGFSIEYPVGRICYQSPMKIRDLKISPKGDRLAFFEREKERNLFRVKCWTSKGQVETWQSGGVLSSKGGFSERDLRGMAWNREGDGLFIAVQGNLIGLVKRNREQVLHRNAGNLRILGATAEGPLLDVGTEVVANRGRLKGQDKEQDLSWAGGIVNALSSDGTRLLVSRDSEIWILPADRSKGHKVGSGTAEALSADGLTVLYTDSERIIAAPAEGGDSRVIATREELKALGIVWTEDRATSARFVLSEDGRWVLIFSGQALARRRADGSGELERVEVTADRLGTDWKFNSVASPNGNLVAMQIQEAGERRWFLAMDLEARKELSRLQAEDAERLAGWRGNAFLTFLAKKGKGEFRLVDSRGQRQTLQVLEPPFSSASGRFRNYKVSGDGAFYVYRYTTTGLSQLMVGKGL